MFNDKNSNYDNNNGNDVSIKVIIIILFLREKREGLALGRIKTIWCNECD